MVSLFAFIITAYGMNPYLVASFSSTLACETAKSSIMAASLEQNMVGTSTYAMVPKNMKCIATPGLMAPGTRPPELSTLKPASSSPPAVASGQRRPAKK